MAKVVNFIKKNKETLAGLLVATVAFLVYTNSLSNGFVWDDSVVIVKNPALQGTPLSLFSGIDSGRDVELTPYYRPLTLLMFLIEERSHGLVPFSMHFTNILLHAVNAFLVYLLAQSFLKNIRAALLAGLLFAVHPINTEAVDFISGGRNTMLACFFVLMSYLLHQKSILRNNVPVAFAGAFFFIAGLFSKETALMIFPFILALEILPLCVNGHTTNPVAFIRLAPYFIGAIIYFVLRWIALSSAGVSLDILPGLGMRLLDNLYIIPRYFFSVICPTSLSIKYLVPDDLHLLALPLVVLWICIIVVLGWLLTRGRTPATLFGLTWFLSFWLPVSGIIPIPSAPLADRYLYAPAIGLWIIVAEQFSLLFCGRVKFQRYYLIAAAAVLIILAVLTTDRNRDWKNDVALFSQYVKRNPNRAFGHHNLGCAYMDQSGDLNAAEREFKKTLALDPFFPRLHTQMGYIQMLRGDYDGAVHHYNEAIVQNPFDAEAFLNRAIALDKLGRYEDAVADYKRFLAIPGNELAGARPHAEARVFELTR